MVVAGMVMPTVIVTGMRVGLHRLRVRLVTIMSVMACVAAVIMACMIVGVRIDVGGVIGVAAVIVVVQPAFSGGDHPRESESEQQCDRQLAPVVRVEVDFGEQVGQ